MRSNPSNELLREYLGDLDRREPCDKDALHACAFGFRHKGILSLDLTNRGNIGRRFEICCSPTKDEERCVFHGTPSRSQVSCEALADLFAYIASLEPAPWNDDSFVDFACASTIAFNHRAAQARIDPPNVLQRHWLAVEHAFPPYVDLPVYTNTASVIEPPPMVTPITFAGLLAEPLPRKTGLLPARDHRVKVPVALYQIHNFQASVLECVGIKRGHIVEFTLCQTGIFAELGIQESDRRVLASLQIYLPAQAKWCRAPWPSDKLHLFVGEGVIYRLPDVTRTPGLRSLIQQFIPRALLAGGPPLPGLLAHGQHLDQPNDIQSRASKSASVSTFATSSGVRGMHGPSPSPSPSSFTNRRIHRQERAAAQLPISKACRGRRLSTPPSAPVGGMKAMALGRQRSASAKVKRPTVVASSRDDVIDISDDLDEIADHIVKKSAHFWQEYLKGPSGRCIRVGGTESNPINLIDVGSELENDMANIL